MVRPVCRCDNVAGLDSIVDQPIPGDEMSLDTRTETEEPVAEAAAEAAEILVEDELLVEEVSIDGMCGVY